MDKFNKQLNDLNALAGRIYAYVEQSGTTLTRRRLLVLQKLLYIDANANAVARLLMSEPRYLDGAAMILRSMYDLGISIDWVLKSRDNKRLWRWLRDDRKMLHDRLKNIIDLKTKEPKLNSVGDPLVTWQQTFTKVDKELKDLSAKVGVKMESGGVSLLNKAIAFNKKSQLIYHTVFWLFSIKTHASATGLQDLITLNPLKLKRRNGTKSAAEETEAEMFMKISLLWYSAHIRQTAQYLKVPFAKDAQDIYNFHIAPR